MKKLFIFTLTICANLFIQANSTQCTDFISKDLSNAQNRTIIIQSKSENIEKYEDHIESQFISSIISGKGYLKQENKRKQKIHYICLMENYSAPIWGYVFKD